METMNSTDQLVYALLIIGAIVLIIAFYVKFFEAAKNIKRIREIMESGAADKEQDLNKGETDNTQQ